MATARPKAAPKAATTKAKPATTTAELTRANNAEVAVKERTRMGLAARYRDQEKVKVVGSPMYRPYFGNTMPISQNGIYISVPLDGRAYEIPKSFARVFNTRIRSVDDDLNLQKQLSNVQSNRESYAGELDLVSLV